MLLAFLTGCFIYLTILYHQYVRDLDPEDKWVVFFTIFLAGMSSLFLYGTITFLI